MKPSELSNGKNRIALRQLLQNRKLRHLWRHNLGSRWKLQKMARENFSIGALYNITKNQDNPIKTVGRDSYLSPKTHKNTSFLGITQPPGSHSPYILGDTTRPRRITYVQVWSKSDQRRPRKTLHKQTDGQTDTTKIMVTRPWTYMWHRFVQARCTFCHPTNSVRALKETLSKVQENYEHEASFFNSC